MSSSVTAKVFSEFRASGIRCIALTSIGSAAEHVVAFARLFKNQTVICVVPRHFYGLQIPLELLTTTDGPPRADWGDTGIALSEQFSRTWHCCLSGEIHSATIVPRTSTANHSTVLKLADLFAVLPIALLTPEIQESAVQR